MKAIVLILGSLLLALPCEAADNAIPSSQEAKADANAPQKPAEKSDQEVSPRRQRIEASYARKIADLQADAEKRIKSFEENEHAELAKSAVKPIWFQESLGHVPKQGYTRDADGLLLSDERAALTESRIAQKKKQILAELAESTAALEKEKNYLLSVDPAVAKKQPGEAVVEPTPQTHGLLKGIVYGQDKRSALVDRNIVHEQETIYGVTVVRIYRRRVVFEKNSETWEQKVGSPAEAFWGPPPTETL